MNEPRISPTGAPNQLVVLCGSLDIIFNKFVISVRGFLFSFANLLMLNLEIYGLLNLNLHGLGLLKVKTAFKPE